MKRIARSNYQSGFFHVMVQGLNKGYIFEKSTEKEEYLSLLLKYKSKFKLILVAYCIMDNHAHLLIYADAVNEMSQYMRVVNSKFARYYNLAYNRVGYVFRDRYNSQYINSQNYLIKCLNYIHMNPVNAKMVENPQDYKYSTYNSYLKPDSIINTEVIKKIFGEDKNYMEKLSSISDNEIEIMDIDREEKNLMIAIENYVSSNKSNLNIIKKDINCLGNFVKYLVLDKKYKQAQIANLLQIDTKRIYYALKKIKETKKASQKNEKVC